jgi:hypothetical protein
MADSQPQRRVNPSGNYVLFEAKEETPVLLSRSEDDVQSLSLPCIGYFAPASSCWNVVGSNLILTQMTYPIGHPACRCCSLAL